MTAAVRRRNEGIDDDDGAEVEGGVALLQLRETAAAAAQRMPCRRRAVLARAKNQIKNQRRRGAKETWKRMVKECS